MAASSSSAAANPNRKSFDVFINHRGVDTKKSFAKCLHRDLCLKGLKAFIDNKEMQQGYDISSQIEHAVRTASIHVAVFSPRYAESDWCLKELVMMLESEAPIIPVFYRVTPGEVRWANGKYGEALHTHEQKQRYDSNIIKKWKETLNKVASNSGFELKACKGDNELELMLDLVDEVVKSVLERVEVLKLQATVADLYVAEYPTGLDYRLKDFEDKVLLPQQQSGNSQIFGIVGFDGVGKTALATQFFNRKKSEYVRSCFLFEVNAAKLESLQTQLLKSLTGLDQQVDTVRKGKGMLMEPLKSCNALVILDDVDDMEQVRAILPIKTHELCSGSLILITSRNRDVLRTRVDELSIYKLTELGTQHSLELFCSHAFSQTYPLPGFEDLVDQFLKSCNGLPSILTEFGALLSGKDISEWKDELRSLPNNIKKRLQITYDTLKTEEQQIFLDIACVFIGQNRETAISIWNASGWRGSRRGLQNLQDKSLVEVDRCNLICMPDHIRDLGRDVAASSWPRRLWHTGTKNIDNLLQQSSEITVRAILMDSKYNGHYDDDVSDINDSQKIIFKRIMRNVQILDTKGSLLEPILRRVEIVPNLIWLRWENCPHSSLPSWVPIKNLRVLRVSGSQLLKTLWRREGRSQPPLQLPECLEELWADGCVQLKSIRGLEQATKLRNLIVSGCSGLEELSSMESLVSLEGLWVDGCVQLKSIKGLEHATKLRKLIVSRCSELDVLSSMESLVSLEELEVDGCVKLKSIRGLAQATKLRKLIVSRCSELEELSSMEGLVSLEELWADGCVQLKSIRGLEQSTKLRKLIVNRCSELEELSNMECLVSLEELWADGCVQLKSIKGLDQSTKLRKLIVSRCSELEELSSMECLVYLEELWADGCVQLKSIRGLEQSTKLRKLFVSRCSELEELSSMEGLVSLEELWADGCVKLKSISGLEQSTKLRKLIVSSCSELEELSSMECLVYLEELWADGCEQLKSIRGLEQSTKLRKLFVSRCSKLEELPSMEYLVSLEELWADGCVQLKSIRGLELQSTKLRKLFVSRCCELEELPSMESLVSLEELWVDGCVQLKSIKGLEQLTKLRKLFVGRCSELVELSSMEGLVSLEELWADGCVQLKSIRGLEQSTNLQKLIVSRCSKLEELSSMEGLVSLEELWADGCVHLKSIRGLEQSTKLRKLIVSRCSELEELSSMEGLVSLEELWADGCGQLKSIKGLEHATKLRKLIV